MNNLDNIIKNQMIFSYENNITFKNQIVNNFNSHYNQNIKYHIMWLFFHSFSFSYPDNPSEDYKIETANFIANIIPKNLGGCGGCQNDYKIYIEKLNIYRIISSKQELSTFFVDLHNYINNKKFQQNKQSSTNLNIIINNTNQISQPIFYKYDDVKSKFEETDYIQFLETKYNINIFKLIENKSLATFYDIFNNIKFELELFNINIQIT